MPTTADALSAHYRLAMTIAGLWVQDLVVVGLLIVYLLIVWAIIKDADLPNLW